MAIQPITVRIETVLLETDVPDLVLARDRVGAQYLCCFIEREEPGDLFLVIPISVERLSQFRKGEVDLRSIVMAPETGQHFNGRFKRVDGDPLIQLKPLKTLPDDWLPDEGFRLSDFVGKLDNEALIREALAKDAAVIECHFEPIEARGARPKINADHLAEGVRTFQALVKHAYKKKLAMMAAVRRMQLGADGYVMQAFAFSDQSFCVHFESKRRANLVGESELGLAMHKVDELMSVLEVGPDEQIPILRANAGHMVSALRRLFEFVAKQSVPITYKWAEPATRHLVEHHITPIAARAVSAILEATEDLEAEAVEFEGTFVRVSTDLRTWRARDVEGKVRQGAVHEDAPDVLAGTVNESVRYQFDCEERLQVKPATGREVPKLFLRGVTRLPQK
ncbi:MAG TPA: DUF6575 domain-containing protein [Vicinamibacterales bacterium]|nr:DUF6575 domain-containing protein [Vicinamibacterales bacterium]